MSQQTSLKEHVSKRNVYLNLIGWIYKHFYIKMIIEMMKNDLV